MRRRISKKEDEDKLWGITESEITGEITHHDTRHIYKHSNKIL